MPVQEKTDRNKEIYEKKHGLNGFRQHTYRELGDEYKLATQRIAMIIQHHREKYINK